MQSDHINTKIDPPEKQLTPKSILSKLKSKKKPKEKKNKQSTLVYL